MSQRRQRQCDCRFITVRSYKEARRAIRGACSISRGMNCIARGEDKTGHPRVRARKQTARDPQRSYTGKCKGIGGLYFFDHNSGRTKKETSPPATQGGLVSSPEVRMFRLPKTRTNGRDWLADSPHSRWSSLDVAPATESASKYASQGATRCSGGGYNLSSYCRRRYCRR